jgi:hypothetical protein
VTSGIPVSSSLELRTKMKKFEIIKLKLLKHRYVDELSKTFAMLPLSCRSKSSRIVPLRKGHMREILMLRMKMSMRRTLY